MTARRDNRFEKTAAAAPIRILAQSATWLVLDKPAGLLVHPTRRDGAVTLHGLLQQWLAADLASSGQISLVHRLDRETSGVMLVARTRAAAAHFSRQLEAGAMQKEYRLIVFGWPDWQQLEMDAPILRGGSRGPFRIWLKQSVHPDGASATTKFEVLDRWERGGERFSLLEARPGSGRMHQIRVHAAAVGHPLVGDKIYGRDEGCYLRFIESGWTPELAAALHLPRHALHAHRLRFVDPDGNQVEVTAPPPADLKAFAGTWP